MDAIHAHYNFTDYYLEAYKQTHAETINPNIIEYHTAFTVILLSCIMILLNTAHIQQKNLSLH